MNANIIAGWTGIAIGIVCGAGIGLFFHLEQFLGGYSAFPRRLLRLGHIAFFGLGFINLAFGLTTAGASNQPVAIDIASWLLIVGAALMPVICFLTAWKKVFRHLFPIPVLSVLGGICILIDFLAEGMP